MVLACSDGRAYSTVSSHFLLSWCYVIIQEGLLLYDCLAVGKFTWYHAVHVFAVGGASPSLYALYSYKHPHADLYNCQLYRVHTGTHDQPPKMCTQLASLPHVLCDDVITVEEANFLAVCPVCPHSAKRCILLNGQLSLELIMYNLLKLFIWNIIEQCLISHRRLPQKKKRVTAGCNVHLSHIFQVSFWCAVVFSIIHLQMR